MSDSWYSSLFLILTHNERGLVFFLGQHYHVMNVDFSFAVAESKQRLDLIFQERLPLASPWNTNSEWLLLILLAIQDEVSEFMKREAVPWDPWN